MATGSEDGAEALARFADDQRGHLVRLGWALGGDLAVAEDAAQDALERLARRWSDVSDPVAFCRVVVLNRFRSRWRSVTRERAALVRLGARRGEDIEMPDPAVEMWRAVRSLPIRQRQALVLAVLEDRTFEEVGALLGCSSETARTHVRRARRELARTLRDEEAGS